MAKRYLRIIIFDIFGKLFITIDIILEAQKQSEIDEWRIASGVLCDCKIPIKLNENFIMIGLALMYSTICWVVTKNICSGNECNSKENVEMNGRCYMEKYNKNSINQKGVRTGTN